MTVGELIGVLTACNMADEVQVRIEPSATVYSGRIAVTYDAYDRLTLVVKNPRGNGRAGQVKSAIEEAVEKAERSLVDLCTAVYEGSDRDRTAALSLFIADLNALCDAVEHPF